jgi:hypothetical protein
VVAAMQHRGQRTRRRDPQAAYTYVARNSVQVHWSDRRPREPRLMGVEWRRRTNVWRGITNPMDAGLGRAKTACECHAQTGRHIASFGKVIES